jgi:uncharacterized protein YndB with AHSA1/START domain
MEHGSIEREIRIDAAPDVVFDVVSNPEHVKQWWPDDARFEPTPGAMGEIAFTMPAGERAPVGFQVVDAVAHRLFSFRWTQSPGEPARPDNSMLVTFELTPDGDGTLLRMTETGFRERGWDDAKVAAEHADHVAGWDHFLPRLQVYGAGLGARR